MKKGFHSINDSNNQHPNQQSNNQSTSRINHNSHPNNQEQQNRQRRQSSGFSSCNNSSFLPNTQQQTQNTQNLNLSIGQGPFLSSYNPMNGQAQHRFQGYNIFAPTNQNPFSALVSQFGGGNLSNMSPDPAQSEAMIMALFQIIESQAKSLQKLFQKVEQMTLKINEFNQKMMEMKKNKNQSHHDTQKPLSSISLNQNVENIDSKSLIKILFGANKSYDFKLELVKNMDSPLYRERNFQIQLRLVSSAGKIVENNNKIPLSLALYSSQNPPKFIQKNTTGQKILKGYVEQSLHHGFCRFQKIQIRQVTSHFRNGWVFIVIIPCMTPLGSANPNQNFIDYVKIQPLVLQKIVVKAKKIKEKAIQKSKQQNSQDKQDSEQVQNRSSLINGGSKQLEIQEEDNSKRGTNKIQENSEQIYDEK